MYIDIYLYYFVNNDQKPKHFVWNHGMGPPVID